MTHIYTSHRYIPPHKPTEFIFCSFRSVPLNDLKVGSHPEINPLSNNILFNTLNSKLPSICHSKHQQKNCICFLALSSALFKEKNNLRAGTSLLCFNTIFGTAESWVGLQACVTQQALYVMQKQQEK